MQEKEITLKTKQKRNTGSTCLKLVFDFVWLNFLLLLLLLWDKKPTFTFIKFKSIEYLILIISPTSVMKFSLLCTKLKAHTDRLDDFENVSIIIWNIWTKKFEEKKTRNNCGANCQKLIGCSWNQRIAWRLFFRFRHIFECKFSVNSWQFRFCDLNSQLSNGHNHRLMVTMVVNMWIDF